MGDVELNQQELRTAQRKQIFKDILKGRDSNNVRRA